MKIGAIAKNLDIPASTIRYYERIGLIKAPPRISGRRHFDMDAVQTLRFIKLAQAAKFSIEEIKELLGSYRDDPGPRGMWKPFAEDKRKLLHDQIADLQKADKILSAMLSCKCQTLAECVSKAEDRKPE